MVDGKEFFGGDVKTGLKNLPVNMIDKLKTYDKKSDLARVTGIDDGEEETVLDLKVKKGIKRFILKKKECDYQEEVIIDLVNVFREIALERFDKLYDEKYGERDALFELDRMVCDVALLNKTFKRVKHHFKKFNVYTDTVSEQFEELAKNLRLLYDIENGRVESLK